MSAMNEEARTVESSGPRDTNAHDAESLSRGESSSNPLTMYIGAPVVERQVMTVEQFLRERDAIMRGQYDILEEPRIHHWRWEEVLGVHPAAGLFPMMGSSALQDLAKNIKQHGLLERVTYTGKPGEFVVLDGKNRLAAMSTEVLNGDIIDEHGNPRPEYFEHRDVPDPVAWIISKNIQRRHLNTEQRRKLIAKLLALTPEKSNRAVAKTIGVDDKTVGAVRKELEAGAEFPHLKKLIGSDGKAQPAKKPTTTPKPAKIANRELSSGTNVPLDGASTEGESIPTGTNVPLDESHAPLDAVVPIVTTTTAPDATTVPEPSTSAAAHIAGADEVQAILDQINTTLVPGDLFLVAHAVLERITNDNSDIPLGYQWNDKFKDVAKQAKRLSVTWKRTAIEVPA